MTAATGAPRRAPAPPAARTVPELLDWRCAQHPDRVAIEVHGVDRLTFADWQAGSRAVATALRRAGLRPGDRVGLVFGARDWTGYAVAYCGVLRAGAVAVPLSERLAAGQLEYALRHCDAQMVVHGSLPDDPGATGATGATGDPGATGTVAGTDATGPATPDGIAVRSVAELIADSADSGGVNDTGRAAGGYRVRPDDLAQILYTSGTTGRPKGVGASHANLVAGAPRHPRRLALAHSERFLHAFPIGTNAGQTMLFNALTAKPTALTLPLFTPVRFARLIATPGTGTVFLVPSMAIELLESGALHGRDTSGVQLIGSTAAALAPAVAARLADSFPAATIVNYYSSTEAAPAQTVMIFDPARRTAVGRAIDGQLRIADDAGRPVPPGTVGEVWLRCAHPRSYYRDDHANRDTFRDGWVRMGDLGRLDEDGYLYLADRHQDMIKSGAFKISTLEVEAALHDHPAVAEAAVVAMPHPVLGSAVAAVLVPRPGVPATDLALPQVRAFLAGRLADYQLPARVVVTDTLPRNDAGKVLKRQLTALFDPPAD
ncbi:class I adenylate-forming enzyme family protein [Solwaraspora sp. WMMD406]|uniref:class I adenylate-forming enzyme family protein n=1 Tax=Solwaraspora sp. WMMD406 TaxID=3016095 RepID=UPI002415A39B|nr:class I adenylate-forming enzyme family protein [Solwaraspora sp. WMMD406]MDG4764529.1 class I adenylate-forming enzyme family protein [Solwaraspora sp. WMMD406]